MKLDDKRRVASFSAIGGISGDDRTVAIGLTTERPVIGSILPPARSTAIDDETGRRIPTRQQVDLELDGSQQFVAFAATRDGEVLEHYPFDGNLAGLAQGVMPIESHHKTVLSRTVIDELGAEPAAGGADARSGFTKAEQ